MAVRVCVAFVAVATAGGHPVQASPQSPPVLRTGVDIVTIDVQVAPTKGAAMRQLTAADFEITISGRRREAASASLMHYDEGTVTSGSTARSVGGASSDCVFGFHRKDDRTTAHYLVGVDRNDADRKEVKDVRVKIVDKALTVQWYVWRSPIRRSASPRVAG